jgi:hypothetical protein
MHAHTSDHTRPDGRATLHAPSGYPSFGGRSAQITSRYSSHGRAALATAIDGGLMPDEVRHILGGRRVVEAFPVLRGESPATYAARAVSEMFVAYLS